MLAESISKIRSLQQEIAQEWDRINKGIAELESLGYKVIPPGKRTNQNSNSDNGLNVGLVIGHLLQHWFDTKKGHPLGGEPAFLEHFKNRMRTKHKMTATAEQIGEASRRYKAKLKPFQQ